MAKHTQFKHLKKGSHLKFYLFFLIICILLLGLGLFSFELKYKDRFYPGVFIAGESVGGQTYSEVLNHFEEKTNQLEQNGLDVNFENSHGIQKVNIPISLSGVTPDNSVQYFTLGNLDTDLEKAYKWGHEKNLIQNLKDQVTLLFAKKYFNLNNVVQKEAVDSFLEDEVYNLQKKTIPATFSFVNGKVAIAKEIEGETIDRDTVLNTLEERITELNLTPVTFIINKDIPYVTEEKLGSNLGLADNLANKNLVFQYKKGTWKVSGSKLVTWLTINKENSIEIDSTKLENYLEGTVGKLIDNRVQNSRFEMQNGNLVEIVPGKSGNAIDMADVLKKVEEVITEIDSKSENNTVNIPIKTVVVESKITKDTVEKYRILDLVGEIRTSFNGSTADREHNIKIGVSKINGMLIPPNAEFSTVASIGAVTEKEGYVKEMVIRENKTTKELGGGLCQIATTLFRLALNAGLPITERINHRFVVHYYDPPGLDATIYGPHPDLRFVNDTGNYLLLQARVENKEVIMELYGQRDGRTAELSKPVMYNRIPAPPTKYIDSSELLVGQTKCLETPHDGITTDVLYIVKYPDGTIKEKNFHSIYQPWQKVCLLGTASIN